MKKEIKNIEDSVRAKLHNKSKEAGVPFLEILRNYAGKDSFTVLAGRR